MVYTDRTDVCNNHTPSISDPRQDLGLIPDQSVIEIKWCIRLENEDEIDVWWRARILSISDSGDVDVLYDPMPRLGFPRAEMARVKFVNRFYVEHDVCESEVGGDDGRSSNVMPWRFEGEDRDIDTDGIDDVSEPAVDVIRKELSEEIKNRDPGEQRILASKVHNALEAFKDEILREALDHNNEINDQNAQNILARVQQRLLHQDQQ